MTEFAANNAPIPVLYSSGRLVLFNSIPAQINDTACANAVIGQTTNMLSLTNDGFKSLSDGGLLVETFVRESELPSSPVP